MSVYVHKTTCRTMLENNRKSTLTLKLFVNSGQNSSPIHFTVHKEIQHFIKKKRALIFTYLDNCLIFTASSNPKW